MPRSRSRSIESRYCAFMSRASTAPVISRMRSESVDLPWSMWAMTEKLRIRERSMGRAGRLTSAGGVDRLRQAALAASHLVRVDDTLGGGLVKALHRHAHGLGVVIGAGRGQSGLHAGLQLALDGLVALGALRVREIPLHLALDVGHWSNPLLVSGISAPEQPENA